MPGTMTGSYNPAAQYAAGRGEDEKHLIGRRDNRADESIHMNLYFNSKEPFKMKQKNSIWFFF